VYGADVRRAPLALVLLVAALMLAPVQARQDWKPIALASFDDAWQTINDTFYDPAFGGLDWKAVRAELRPKAEAAATPDDVRHLITEMITRLKQSHFVLLPSGGPAAESNAIGPAAVPIDVRVSGSAFGWSGGALLLVTRVEPGSEADREGVRPGQIVRQIDGTPVSMWIAATPPGGDERVHSLEMWRQATHALHGARGSTAVLRLSDGDTESDVRVPRVVESGQVVTVGNLPPFRVRVEHRAVDTPAGKRVGVIAFNIWLAQIDKPITDAIDEYRNLDGLVIDLRGNPGGLAAMIQGIAGQFMTDDTAVLGKMRMRDTELTFHPNPRLSMADGRRVTPFAGPVALLVDDLTGSASECFAAGLQSLSRVRVFGRQTMGEALPAETKRLPDGDVLMHVVGDFVTSTGRRVEGQGVVPDEAVALTAGSFKGAHDPDLDAALAWIDRVRGT
jgi:carboxyl-terminal processing protease